MRSARLALLLSAAALVASPVLAQARGKSPNPDRQKIRFGLALAPGDAAPEFGGIDLEGGRRHVSFESHAATLVNFWATTCQPCALMLPVLQKLHAAGKGDRLQVVGVVVDQGEFGRVAPAARAALDAHGARYLNLRTTLEIEGAWRGITVLPNTYLVGRDGKLLRRYIGANDAILAGLEADLAAFRAGKPLPEQVLPDQPEDASAPR